MNRLKNKVISMALIFSLGISASGCGLIEKSPEAIAKQRVAKIGDEYITRGELDEMFTPMLEQLKASPQYGADYLESAEGKELLKSQKTETLDGMIEQKLFEQKSKELNLFKDENEISEGIKTSRDNLVTAYGSEEELNKKLEEAKISNELFDKILRGQVISQKVTEHIIKDVTVSDEAVQKYYDENKASMTEQPNTMNVSHILLKTEEDAKAVKQRLLNGEDFATVAKEKSTEEAAQQTGGDLGEIMYNDPNYDQDFVKAAMALKEGEISDPVLTQFGYHIIKVTKKTEYPIQEFDAVKDSIKYQLVYDEQYKVYSDALSEWREKAGVEVYEDKIV
ncbi:foldase protein PrsA 3 precursor [Oxobacter pfennigii]|uniref:peptidylprolyl isomerase n=1 Tax=Oxobacter pfennigii TaxID=36849 RepID=A0A0N8NSR7_9CLOT|nr:peptidylprolyl isomerase [Oxobacter pfennigii]KPU42784.1 foldase protein PrsA 3 precursor [Oxobacter pfennigii]